MDMKRTLVRLRARERERERDEVGKTNVGYSRFLSMMIGMERAGWAVPGHEELTRALTVAAIVGDDVATAQLHDLFEQEGHERWSSVKDLVDSFRHTYGTWNDATKKTFLRHCREKGIYRKNGF